MEEEKGTCGCGYDCAAHQDPEAECDCDGESCDCEHCSMKREKKEEEPAVA